MNNIKRHWKTSVAGVATIGLAITLFVKNGWVINESVIGMFTAGVGLLFGADSDKNGKN